MTDPERLPPDLPVPLDDGACRHLPGLRMPALALPGTGDGTVDLGRATPAWAVFYCFPRASQPGVPPPPDWDRIPGARGCTAQACDFRDHHQRLAALGAVVFGISTQTRAVQQEVATKLHLPFELLSDDGFRLTEALGLPTFAAGGLRLLRRLTLVVRHAVIEAVFYPIFPPDRSTVPVIDWLASRQTG